MRISSPFISQPASPKAQQRQGVTYFKASTVHEGLGLWRLDSIGDIRGLQSLAAELNEQLEAKELITVTKKVIRETFIAPLEELVKNMNLTGVYNYPNLIITKKGLGNTHEILGLRIYNEQRRRIASAGEQSLWLPQTFTYANAQDAVPLFNYSTKLGHVLEQGAAALSEPHATGTTLQKQIEHLRQKEAAQAVLRDTYGIDVTKDSWPKVEWGIPQFFFNFLSNIK
jgi:hypothetical protein